MEDDPTKRIAELNDEIRKLNAEYYDNERKYFPPTWRDRKFAASTYIIALLGCAGFGISVLAAVLSGHFDSSTQFHGIALVVCAVIVGYRKYEDTLDRERHEEGVKIMQPIKKQLEALSRKKDKLERMVKMMPKY